MPLKIDYQTTGFANIKKSYANRILKEALLGMGYQWWRLFYPKRFKPNAKNIYHLKDRTRKYRNRVRKFFPNWRPLVRTGELQEISIKQGKVMAKTTKGVQQIKVSMQRGHPTQKYVSAELTKILQKELKILMRDYKKDIIARIKLLPKEAYTKGVTKKTGMRSKTIRAKTAVTK